MLRAAAGNRWVYPITVWFILLVIIFTTEYFVMLLLPWVLPQTSSRLVESIVDSVVLTLVLAPILWWMLVRPMREVIRLRTQFLADLYAQIEADRRQTAHELHDGVGQALTLLISGLRSANTCRATPACSGRVNGFQELAENALTEVRRLALGLRPSLLDDLGLAPALERLVEDTRSHYPGFITVEVTDIIGRQMPDSVATAIFRITQEALANIVKHSQAHTARVAIRCPDQNIVVKIDDDGCGIEPERLHEFPPGHLGLRGMRERATLLGGAFRIESMRGQGTHLTITIPAHGEADGQGTADVGGRSQSPAGWAAHVDQSAAGS